MLLINSLPTHVQQFLCYNKTNIWSSSEVVIDTYTLSTGALIIIDFINDGNPVFLKIEHLLIPHTGHLDIIGKLLLPVRFVKKYYAYEVVEYGWAHCHPDSQRDCVLLWPYKVNGEANYLISLPYYVPPWSML